MALLLPESDLYTDEAVCAGSISQIQQYAAALGRPVSLNIPRRSRTPGTARQLGLDLSGGVVHLVPNGKNRLLSQRLSEFFARACGAKFLRYGFKLEREDIAFIGDLIQLEPYQVREQVRPTAIFNEIIEALARYDLFLGMSAPTWQRPIDRFTHRHWVG